MQNSRSNAMKQQFDVSKPTKSGFNLSQKSHIGGVPIGRLIPSCYYHCMPGDKFSAQNNYKLYFEQLVTPVVSDVNVIQRNFFVTYRSIDSGFEDLLTPTKQNGMSASLSAPVFSLRQIVKFLYREMISAGCLTYFNSSYKIVYNASYSQFWNNFVAHSIYWNSDPVVTGCYNSDLYSDLLNQLEPLGKVIVSLSSSSTQEELDNAFVNFYCKYFDFFCGEGSNMDYLGYPIMKHSDTKNWLLNMVSLTRASDGKMQDADSAYETSDESLSVDNRLVNEYALRALYAIWFEHFRVDELEPRSANLPEYRHFGSTALLAETTPATLRRNMMILLPLRADYWDADPFTTSQVDDISRHVYAPLAPNEGNVSYAGPSEPAQANAYSNPIYSTDGNLLSEFKIGYISPLDGLSKSISLPLPNALSDIDINYSTSFDTAEPYILPLFTLKKAQMLERYLKRNYAFGDEYRDRMRAHFDVTIEDYRINRPVEISSTFKPIEIKQEVANTGAVPGTAGNMIEQGQRLATATADNTNESDIFEFFTPEFGIYIQLLSVVPRAQYDHVSPLNFMQKTMDFPTPEFAAQQEDINNISEIMRMGVYDVDGDTRPFGHVPYAHGYRYRIDEVHGQMLSEKFDYTFCRFYRGLTADGRPKLNSYFLHCRPNIPMFLNQILLDGQIYGTLEHEFLVERLLPTPVESI